MTENDCQNLYYRVSYPVARGSYRSGKVREFLKYKTDGCRELSGKLEIFPEIQNSWLGNCQGNLKYFQSQ